MEVCQQQLKCYWDWVYSQGLCEPRCGDPVFEGVLARYSEAHRHYHGPNHLLSLFRDLERDLPDYAQSAALRLAIWFHDVIYNTKRRDNEARSAVFAVEQMRVMAIDAALEAPVEELILATKDHKINSDEGRHFMDLDMSILGAPVDDYVFYANAVRAECAWMPKIMFGKLRGNFLKKTLAR